MLAPKVVFGVRVKLFRSATPNRPVFITADALTELPRASVGLLRLGAAPSPRRDERRGERHLEQKLSLVAFGTLREPAQKIEGLRQVGYGLGVGRALRLKRARSFLTVNSCSQSAQGMLSHWLEKLLKTEQSRSWRLGGMEQCTRC